MVEYVLVYLAAGISKIPKQSKKEFMTKVNEAIRLFPGNFSRTQKTIDNWRTEISTLFGFIEFDSTKQLCKPGRIARMLADNQDLAEFFKVFLFYFQFPGAFKKPHNVLPMIKAGIRFKPAKYILNLLQYAERIQGSEFRITKAEVTHCIMNDLRVTRDDRPVTEVLALIINNRNNRRLSYDNNAQITRYAKDILDYMYYGNLLVISNDGHYRLNQSNQNTIDRFITSDTWFGGYDDMYSTPNITNSDVRDKSDEWFKYVNQSIEGESFRTDLSEHIQSIQETAAASVVDSFRNIMRQARSDDFSPQEIGGYGENIIIEHERNRLSNNGRGNLRNKVKKIPDHLGVGYDIISAELDEMHRYVEVKTTISKKPFILKQFHLTTNEWVAAEGHGEQYFVYRLMLSEAEIKLFIIQDPVRKYKTDFIKMVPRDGADVTFDYEVGEWQELLI